MSGNQEDCDATCEECKECYNFEVGANFFGNLCRKCTEKRLPPQPAQTPLLQRTPILRKQVVKAREG